MPTLSSLCWGYDFSERVSVKLWKSVTLRNLSCVGYLHAYGWDCCVQIRSTKLWSPFIVQCTVKLYFAILCVWSFNMYYTSHMEKQSRIAVQRINDFVESRSITSAQVTRRPIMLLLLSRRALWLMYEHYMICVGKRLALLELALWRDGLSQSIR